MMIVGVTGLTEDEKGSKGSAGAGKDLVSDHLVVKHGFVKVALADEIKRIAMRLWDFTEQQLWGESSERNKPDERYLLRPKGLYWACTACCVEEFGSSSFEEKSVGLIMARGCDGCGKTYNSLPTDAHRVLLSDKYLTPRHALQQIGTEVARAIDPDVWIRFTLNVAKKLLKKDYLINEPIWQYERTRGVFQDSLVYGGPNIQWASHVCRDQDLPKGVVINDVRYPNEIAGIRKENGHVWRKKWAVATLPGKAATHTSEISLLGLPDEEFNAVFNGGDLNFLYMSIDSTMDRLSGRIIPFDEAQKDIPPFKRT
jgi:hypothetical protein